MLGDEGDRDHDQRPPLRAGAADFRIDPGLEPGERPDTALEAEHAVKSRPAERREYRSHAALDLPAIGVARSNDALGQAMGREQDPDALARGRLVECTRKRLGDR